MILSNERKEVYRNKDRGYENYSIATAGEIIVQCSRILRVNGLVLWNCGDTEKAGMD